MKKLTMGVVVVAVALLVGTVAYGARQGYGPCWDGQKVDVNALRQFQKETLPMRDDLQAKALELRNEYTKETPDKGAIAKLRGEMRDLQGKIQAVADKQGLPDWSGAPGMMRGYGMMRGDGDGYGRGPGGRGGWGHGRMMGGYEGCGGCGR